MNQKNAIVSFTKLSHNSVIASVRISRILSELLKIPVIDGTDKSFLNQSYDTLIIVNGASFFVKWLDELAELVKRSRRVIWVMNDYTIWPPTQIRHVMREMGKQFETWSTVPILPDEPFGRLAVWGQVPLVCTHYVNWNQLTYDPLPIGFHPTLPDGTPIERYKGLFYYGAFREDRIRTFDHFFGSHVDYPVHIAASVSSGKKFKEAYPHINHYMPWETFKDINCFQASLYLHDQSASEFYMSPANRIYECLSARIPLLIEETCVEELKRGGFECQSEFIVGDCSEVAERLSSQPTIQSILEWQNYNWHGNHRNDLLNRIKEVTKIEGLWPE